MTHQASVMTASEVTSSAPAANAAAPARRAVLLILLAPIVGVSFAAKLAVPFLNVEGISLGFPLLYMALLAGVIAGARIELSAGRLLAFCVMAGLIGCVMALAGDKISLPSMALLLFLHLPYVLYLPSDEALREQLLRVFQSCVLTIALCGLAQYVAQFFMPVAYVFPIENFLPDSLRVTGFNMQAPIHYGASVYRPNGIFMAEPSFFSQFLAIGILAELLSFNRKWFVGLCGLSLLLSQSGTGLLLLMLCVPVLIVTRRRWDLLALGLIAGCLLLTLGPLLHMDSLFNRVGEFGSTRSSGYERFVGGFYVFSETLGREPLRLLFGFGAGSYREIVQAVGQPAAEMALFKIVIEFGLIGALTYFGFVFYCLFSAPAPLVLRLALMLSLFLNGAYNSFTHSLAFALLVWSSGPRTQCLPLLRRLSPTPAKPASRGVVAGAAA